MSSNNGSGNLAGKELARASHAEHASSVNGHTTGASNGAQVLDETLDERDVRVIISLNLHGRTTKVVDVSLDRVIFESLEVKDRWILLEGIQATLDELRKVAVVKIKKNLGLDEDNSAQTVVPDEFIVHRPPPLNGAGW